MLVMVQQDAYTGPGLFDWEKDWDVLTTGPFQTRIIQNVEQVAQPQRVAYEGWRPEIEEAMRRVAERRREHQHNLALMAVGIVALVGMGLFIYKSKE